MDRIKLILIYVSVGLSFGLLRGQQIGNYISNGSFEELYNCQAPFVLTKAKGWSGIDSTKFVAELKSSICGNAPKNGVGYQMAVHGACYSRLTFYCPFCSSSRSNVRNRLKGNLQPGKTYCVKMFLNTQDSCEYAIDAFGIFFGDASIDTIVYNAKSPLVFLNPQIKNTTGNFINDTMSWIPVSGTFVASGTEKYAIVSNFRSDALTTTVSTGVKLTPGMVTFSEYFLDAISCIELNLAAYAGSNQLIYLGDSAFIGRKPDWAIDPGCIWYKLPNMTTAIDTISGLWVKPTVTSTYVVRQELDCSPLKWDTVVVTINTNLVALDKLHELSVDISLFPNPTSGNLKVSYSGLTDLDITSYVVINSLGQIVRDEFVHDIPVDIQTSDLGPGLYEIQFKSRYGVLTKKFVRTD